MIAAVLLALGGTLQAQGNAAAPPQTEMQKWLATTDAQWQAAFKRDVTDVHEAELGKLKVQYLTSLDAAITKASAASDLDGALALRNEQKRFAEANVFAEQDIAAESAAVKQVRAAARTQFARLDKDRATRAKALHAKYDQALAQAQSQLTQGKRLDDALLVKNKRAEIAAAWVTPAQPSIPPIRPTEVQNPATPATVATNSATSFQMWSFYEKLKTAAANPRIPKNSLSKRERGKPFQDLPKEGAFLVGFELTKGDWFGAPLFRSLQPIYMTASGKVRGEVHGIPGKEAFTVEARDGYAVGELSFADGAFFCSLEITFMKVDAFHKNLDRKDAYKTEKYGDLSRHPTLKPKTVAGDGSPIIGIFGFADEEMNALGIIQAP